MTGACKTVLTIKKNISCSVIFQECYEYVEEWLMIWILGSVNKWEDFAIITEQWEYDNFLLNERNIVRIEHLTLWLNDWSTSQVIPANPLYNHVIPSVHFNHFYFMEICDKLRKNLAMFTYIYLNVDECWLTSNCLQQCQYHYYYNMNIRGH